MVKIDYLEDKDGSLTKVLVSDSRFETMYLTMDGCEEPELFAVKLTDEMERAIKQEPYGISA